MSTATTISTITGPVDSIQTNCQATFPHHEFDPRHYLSPNQPPHTISRGARDLPPITTSHGESLIPPISTSHGVREPFLKTTDDRAGPAPSVPASDGTRSLLDLPLSQAHGAGVFLPITTFHAATRSTIFDSQFLVALRYLH